MTQPMTPLHQVSPQLWAGVRALFFDIDDTLTTHGQLTAPAFAALWRAREAGLLLVPVTGRPAGWCDHIARMWPVAAVIGENGAFVMAHDGRHLRRIDVLDEAERAANRLRLDALAAQIIRQAPGCALASDQAYRDYDLAIDYCEDVPPLPPEKVARIVACFEAAGATAKVSSIHVNGWFGDYDKRTMVRRVCSDVLGLQSLDAGYPPCAFVGDSPNDQPLFESFMHSFGVANVAQFAATLTHPPRYLADQPCGAGFVQVVEALLTARLDTLK